MNWSSSHSARLSVLICPAFKESEQLACSVPFGLFRLVLICSEVFRFGRFQAVGVKPCAYTVALKRIGEFGGISVFNDFSSKYVFFNVILQIRGNFRGMTFFHNSPDFFTLLLAFYYFKGIRGINIKFYGRQKGDIYTYM